MHVCIRLFLTFLGTKMTALRDCAMAGKSLLVACRISTLLSSILGGEGIEGGEDEDAEAVLRRREEEGKRWRRGAAGRGGWNASRRPSRRKRRSRRRRDKACCGILLAPRCGGGIVLDLLRLLLDHARLLNGWVVGWWVVGLTEYPLIRFLSLITRRTKRLCGRHHYTHTRPYTRPLVHWVSSTHTAKCPRNHWPTNPPPSR